ncbi:MAG: hypothetical protein JST59_02360 [Actinobacteria bacterium]|nr:hypothetical protein [Actinomycetota bacterium]
MDTFQVLVAANRSLQAYLTKKMATKNIHSELVYLISAEKNVTVLTEIDFLKIRDSLKSFGIKESCTRILVALFDSSDERVICRESLFWNIDSRNYKNSQRNNNPTKF